MNRLTLDLEPVSQDIVDLRGMLTLQWQGRRYGRTRSWLLMDVERGCSYAWAAQVDGAGVGEITALYEPGIPRTSISRRGPGVHKLRKMISKEIDRRSIGLFGVDDVVFLPSLIVR